MPLVGYLRIRIIPLAHPVCTATAVRPILALLSPTMAYTQLSSLRRSASARRLVAMFAGGFFRDLIPDAVKSLVRMPLPRLSGGSLGYSVLKYAALLLFLVNIRSWPVMWHRECSTPSYGPVLADMHPSESFLPSVYIAAAMVLPPTPSPSQAEAGQAKCQSKVVR